MVKSLVDYVVDDLLEAGVLLTRDGIKDLLAIMPPNEIATLTPSQAVVIDSLRPMMLVLEQFRSGPIQFLADKVVNLPEGDKTVAELLGSDKYPADFVLAGLKIPKDVCRWYVLEHLSETGRIWPDTPEKLDDLSTLDTRFRKDYLYDEVHAYLHGQPDTAWLSIFGIPDVMPFGVTTTLQLIEVLYKFLQSMGQVQELLGLTSKQAVVDLAWMKEAFGVQSLVHYRPVKVARKLSADFTDLASLYAKQQVASGTDRAAAAEAVVAKIRQDVISKISK